MNVAHGTFIATANYPPKMAPEDVWSAWFVVKTMTVDVFDPLTFVLDQRQQSLTNDFTVVRLKKEVRELFYYSYISGDEFIFCDGFSLIPKSRRQGKITVITATY